MTFQIQPPHGALVKVKSRVGSPLLSFDHSFEKTLLLGIADRVTFNYNILDPPIHTIASSKVGLVSSELVCRTFNHLLLNSCCKRYFQFKIFCSTHASSSRLKRWLGNSRGVIYTFGTSLSHSRLKKLSPD